MAIGDTVTSMESVASGSYCDIRPDSGDEWIIHNIFYENAVEFYFYDGTNEIMFDSDAAGGAKLCMTFHCTYSNRIRVKNITASQYIGYDGIQIK